MKKIATVLCIINDNKILLGMKKRGFGKGRWNGFGGKPDKGESVEDTAIRETEEECLVRVKKVEKVGILDFKFTHKSEWNQQVHFFRAEKYDGKPQETEEMKPKWFEFNDIPYDSMWPDDRYWIPIMLEGKKFKGNILFGENDSILENNIIEADNI